MKQYKAGIALMRLTAATRFGILKVMVGNMSQLDTIAFRMAIACIGFSMRQSLQKFRLIKTLFILPR